MASTLYIKDMVCVRCRMAVQAVLDEAGVPYLVVELGWAKLHEELSPEKKEAVKKGLARYELAVVEDRTKILVEGVKTEILRLLQSSQALNLKLSAHLSQMLGYNYTYLANLFSEQEGVTLERYFIAQRIEKAKELMVYEELPLKEITDALGYSSVSHLCLQFKKVTGQTPAEFKKLSRLENFVWKELSKRS